MQAEFPIFTIDKMAAVIVPVVLPPARDRSLSGRVRNISIRGADHTGWLMQTRHGWQVHPDRAVAGYVLLEDLYRAEGDEDGWAAYKRYLSAWQGGRTSRPFPPHMLPKEVQRRQSGDVGPEFSDPWDIPPPSPTTGAVSEPKPKGKKGE